jgi:hypothetical protein
MSIPGIVIVVCGVVCFFMNLEIEEGCSIIVSFNKTQGHLTIIKNYVRREVTTAVDADYHKTNYAGGG